MTILIYLQEVKKIDYAGIKAKCIKINVNLTFFLRIC